MIFQKNKCVKKTTKELFTTKKYFTFVKAIKS